MTEDELTAFLTAGLLAGHTHAHFSYEGPGFYNCSFPIIGGNLDMVKGEWLRKYVLEKAWCDSKL